MPINRPLVVIHHGKIHELASLRFLKLNLEWQNIKMGRKTYEHLFFSFSFFQKSSYYNSYTWSKNITLTVK